MGPNPHIFREYDIRGIVDQDFTGEVPRLCAASSRWVSKPEIAATVPI